MTNKSELIRDPAAAGATTAISLLAASAGLPIAAVAGLTMTGALVVAVAYSILARRSESFVSTFRRALMESHEGDFDEEVRARIEDPDFQVTMSRALRDLRDAIDDRVAPALAILTKDYTVPKISPVDAFFRNFSDLLRDCSGDEYPDLVLLVDRVSKVDDGKARYLTIATSEQVPGKLAIDGGDNRGDEASIIEAIDAPLLSVELARALRRHGLAADRPDTMGGVFVRAHRNSTNIHWSVHCLIDFATLRRIKSILDRARW